MKDSMLSLDIYAWLQENREKIDMLERQIGTKIILENTPIHKIFNT